MANPYLIDEAEIKRRFTNAPPKDGMITQALDDLTALFIETGCQLVEQLPECREKSLAITALEETSMWSKKAVALNQDQVSAS